MAKISRETWQVALDALRANKVKAALTMLGVVIGSACIVLVVTIALIGKTYVLPQIEGVGSNSSMPPTPAAPPMRARRLTRSPSATWKPFAICPT